jgi:hypothetical protein
MKLLLRPLILILLALAGCERGSSERSGNGRTATAVAGPLPSVTEPPASRSAASTTATPVETFEPILVVEPPEDLPETLVPPMPQVTLNDAGEPQVPRIACVDSASDSASDAGSAGGTETTDLPTADFPTAEFPTGVDGGVSTQCVPPSGICIANTLVYFDNGRCVAGVCEFDQLTLECPERCVSWGCTSSFTVK